MAKKSFKDLTEREILAFAIQLEEEDSRLYGDFAEGLRETYPATAKAFDDMQAEESRHRQMLIEMHRQRFGEHIPLIRRQDIKGFLERRPTWLVRALGIERHHSEFAESLEEKQVATGERTEEDKTSQRTFMLQVVQPGLSGLIDGSISTLAPIFAAAFATHKSRDAFLVGLAASLGAGISMAFTEALSDDGSLTGRGQPVFRGSVTGVMTAIGGLGHTLPFLIGDFHLALLVAMIVVAIELVVISYVRHRYMDTPLFSSALQVIVGGALVFAVGIWIGSS